MQLAIFFAQQLRTGNRSRPEETRCFLSKRDAPHVQRELWLEAGCTRLVYNTQPRPRGPSAHAVATRVAKGRPPLLTETWRPHAGGRPAFPAEGRRAPRPLRALPPSSRLRSCPGRGRSSGAGARRAGGPFRARARRRLLPGPPLPHAPPLPRELESSVAEAAEIGIRPPAARRRRVEGRAGREVRGPARRPAREEDRTAARGATGPGPLHAEGGGRAGPRRPAAVRARLRPALEDEFRGIPVSWPLGECGCAAGGRRSFGRRWPRGGEAATRLSGACGRPRPGRRRSPFCSRSYHPETLLESLNGHGACSRSGASRLVPGMRLGTPGWRTRTKCVPCGDPGRAKCAARPLTWLRAGAGFLPRSLPLGSPVVLRGLRCHVCCDSAHGFRENFVLGCVYIPLPSQTPSGKIRQRKTTTKRIGEEK